MVQYGIFGEMELEVNSTNYLKKQGWDYVACFEAGFEIAEWTPKSEEINSTKKQEQELVELACQVL